ncbi:MAG TPA: glycosyltransferase family 4 protein [Acidimicrobiia bacterium]|nr:glycosyltransferase family 4 protein [Acidimicrobiia bacterium]
MRVGLVCPYDLSKPGGVQTQVADLARHLTDLGDEVEVIGPGLPEAVPGVDLGGTISIRGNRSKVPLSVDPRVMGLIKAGAAGLDLLHVHEPLMPLASLAALRAGIPVVATFHAAPGRVGTGFYKATRSQLKLLLGPNVRRVTAVSPTAAAPLPANLEVSIVPNGVDVSAFGTSVGRHPSKVAFLGRDEKRKGLDVLLAAWSVVSSAVPEAELVVLGADRGTGGVDWRGRVDQTAKILSLGSAALYVAPNLGGESFGIVIVEAMAAGAAVVASDLEAFQYVGGDSVRYFPAGDSDSLARTLIELLGDPGAVSALSSAGRKRAKRYDWTEVTPRYRAIYQEALS